MIARHWLLSPQDSPGGDLVYSFWRLADIHVDRTFRFIKKPQYTHDVHGCLWDMLTNCRLFSGCSGMSRWQRQRGDVSSMFSLYCRFTIRFGILTINVFNGGPPLHEFDNTFHWLNAIIHTSIEYRYTHCRCTCGFCALSSVA